MKSRASLVETLLACLAALAGLTASETRGQGTYSVLSWYDEFDGTAVDPTKWSFELGTGSQYGLTGWGNNELQYYTARSANARVADGLLTITARRENYGGQAYTSARLTTRGHFAQTGGRFEMRAALPLGQGFWPAFWMLPATNVYGGWAASGEIDIMEARGQQPNRIVTAIHYGDRWPGNTSSGTTLTLPSGGSIADFHDYALEWDVGSDPELRWYIDGRLAWRTSAWWTSGGPYPAPFDKPFNLMLNLAVGGNFVGSPDGSTPFPATMQVDYVRAYQAAPADIRIDVPSGASQTQFDAGYARILTADSLRKLGGGDLVFAAENQYSGPTLVEAGRLRVTTSRALADSPTAVAAGGTLAIAGGIAAAIPQVTLAGGLLEAERLLLGDAGIRRLDVEAGAIAGSPGVVVEAGGRLKLPSANRISIELGSLSVAETWGGGLVDLGAGQIVIAAGGIAPAALRADLLAGRNGGSWTGLNGITSTAAASSGGARTIGYLTTAAGATRVSYAASGDTNLDGSVDVFDLVQINGSGTYGTGSPSVWSDGDFTYDGVTNIFDLVATGGSGVYGLGGYFPAAANQPAFATVPEPAVAAWLAAVLAAVGWARRGSPIRRKKFKNPALASPGQCS